MIELGAVFPQTEIGRDPIAIRDFAQAAEGLGYAHISAFEHVVGINPASRPGSPPFYTYQSTFYEPFVLFGYLAGLTTKLGFATEVLVLPQRQTALVAKQAAVVDVLCGGRLRLGIGVGWNAGEFQAMGADFHTRGRRSEEQIALLRALWTNELVMFEGRWDRIEDAGINPLPVQQPIPIWLGGGSDATIRRVGRLADGWFPPARTAERLAADIEVIRAEAVAAGRDPAGIGINGRVWTRSDDERAWRAAIAVWRHPAVTHLSFITMNAGYTSPDQHLDAIRRFMAIARDELAFEC